MSLFKPFATHRRNVPPIAMNTAVSQTQRRGTVKNDVMAMIKMAMIKIYYA